MRDAAREAPAGPRLTVAHNGDELVALPGHEHQAFTVGMWGNVLLFDWVALARACTASILTRHLPTVLDAQVGAGFSNHGAVAEATASGH